MITDFTSVTEMSLLSREDQKVYAFWSFFFSINLFIKYTMIIDLICWVSNLNVLFLAVIILLQWEKWKEEDLDSYVT